MISITRSLVSLNNSTGSGQPFRTKYLVIFFRISSYFFSARSRSVESQTRNFSNGPGPEPDCAVITRLTIVQPPPEFNGLLIVALQHKRSPIERLLPTGPPRHFKLRAT